MEKQIWILNETGDDDHRQTGTVWVSQNRNETADVENQTEIDAEKTGTQSDALGT